MSVFVIARCTVSDLGKALEWGKANGDIAEDITAYGKSLGQIGHKFFAGAARMGEFLGGAGVVGEPEVTVLDAVNWPASSNRSCGRSDTLHRLVLECYTSKADEAPRQVQAC